METQFFIEELIVSDDARSMLSVHEIHLAFLEHQKGAGFRYHLSQLVTLHYSRTGLPFWLVTDAFGEKTELRMNEAGWFAIENLEISRFAASLLTIDEIFNAVMSHQTRDGYNDPNAFKTIRYTRDDMPFWLVTDRYTLQTQLIIDIVGREVVLTEPAMTDTNVEVAVGTKCNVLKHDSVQKTMFVTAYINGQQHGFYVHEDWVMPVKVGVAA